MAISFRSIRDRCVRFAEKEGFPLIVTVCVAVITLSALWTGRHESAYVSPTPPVREQSAAQLLQQSLREAATPTPSPTPAPAVWLPPLKDYTVLQPFDMETMRQSSTTGIWQLHAGVDLAAARGTPVYAMSRGEIAAQGEDALWGVWFRIDHGGIGCLYAGLAAAGDFRPGDTVEAGDTLGFTGDGPLEEQGLGPHLHLEATQNGVPTDPLTLWKTQ